MFFLQRKVVLCGWNIVICSKYNFVPFYIKYASAVFEACDLNIGLTGFVHCIFDKCCNSKHKGHVHIY